MSPERAREIGDDVARELRPRPTHRCEIAQYPTKPLTAVAPPCGAVAEWWTDDLKPGRTVWMCKPCSEQVLLDVDGVTVLPDGDDE